MSIKGKDIKSEELSGKKAKGRREGDKTGKKWAKEKGERGERRDGRIREDASEREGNIK